MKDNYLPRFLSYMLHPLILPTYAFIFLLSLQFNIATRLQAVKFNLIVMVFIATFVLPTLLVLILKNRGVISSLQMKIKEERALPFFLTAGLYYISYRLFDRMGLPDEFSLVILGSTATILIALMINFFWKISIHMMGIGGIAGALTGLSLHYPVSMFYPFVIVIFLAGLLGMARLKLGAHTQGQVYTGFICGYVIMATLFSSLVG